MRRQAYKPEIVVHAVAGRAQHEDPPGPVLAPREDLQAMKHESQVGGCSQRRGAKVERWEWFPLSGGREHAVFGGGLEKQLQRWLRQAHPRGVSSRVLTSLGTLESP